MLELVVGASLTNGLGIAIKENNISNFCQILVDLHLGIPVKRSLDFQCLTGDIIEASKGFVDAGHGNEYLVVELPDIKAVKNTEFAMLYDHIKKYLPSLYAGVLSLAMTPDVVPGIFLQRPLLVFSFKDDLLQYASTLVGHSSADSVVSEYIDKISLRRRNLSEEEHTNLACYILSSPTVESSLSKNTNSGTNYYSYRYNYSPSVSKANFFIRPGYLRLNSYEIMDDKFSLITMRSGVAGTYSANQGFSNLITALISPATLPASYPKTYIGQALLHTFINTSGISLVKTKDVFPVIVNNHDETSIPESANFIDINLSDDDAEFLEKVKSIDIKDVYTKHKLFMVEQDAKPVRGCIDIYNSSKRLKITIREDKKKLSDEEAYKNRMFRDYLSYAISLVCIPIFQKEFVIPEYLGNSFVFKMASLDTAWYDPNYSKCRLSDRYYTVFENDTQDPAWVEPDTTKFDTAAKISKVKQFVKDLKAMTLSSSTQARSSVFTRQFIEPFIEKTANRWTALKAPAFYGWMYAMDNQMQHRWDYKLSSSHLLRNSSPSGYFACDCGLMTDKTFGIKSIMNKVFVTPEFSSLLAKDYSAAKPDQLIPQEKKAQYISAMGDIYSANFVPNDRIESAIRSYGSIDYSCELARVNQLLFVQEESLIILQALYKCNTYEDLSICLDFCMPMCLEIVDNLNYSQHLKNHVSSLLKYFWNTTTAISEEMKPDETKE